MAIENLIKKSTDLELILNIKEKSCDDSFLELVERHTPLFLSTVSRYQSNIRKARRNPDEIIGDKTYIFYKACVDFNISKNTKFSTWLAHQVRFICLNFINRGRILDLDMSNSGVFLESLDDEDFKHKLESVSAESHSNLRDLEAVLASCGGPGALVCKKRYLSFEEKPTWKQISSEMGIGYNALKKMHDATLKKMRSRI